MNTVAKTEGVARKMGIAKKAGIAIGATLAVALVAGYVFRAPLQEAMAAGITADMFVERDADKFDPGVAVGQVFPALNARLTDRACHGAPRRRARVAARPQRLQSPDGRARNAQSAARRVA